jgi:hypothetical protein
MSITLHLPPEIEAGLLAEAEARGVSVGNLLQEVIRRFAERDTPVQSPPGTGRWVQEDAIRLERDLDNLGSFL